MGAAPPMGKLPVSYTGRIRLVSSSVGSTPYISRVVGGKSGAFRTCTDPAEALVVQFVPGDWLHGIEILNSPTAYRYLGATQRSHDITTSGSSMYAALSMTTDPSSAPIMSLCKRAQGPSRAAIWNFCPFDNTIRAFWEEAGVTYLLTAAVNLKYSRISLVSDYTTFCAAHPHYFYSEA
ncbi:hypothetical protein FRB99_000801, partial [Tulasnella sp. 403]